MQEENDSPGPWLPGPSPSVRTLLQAQPPPGLTCPLPTGGLFHVAVFFCRLFHGLEGYHGAGMMVQKSPVPSPHSVAGQAESLPPAFSAPILDWKFAREMNKWPRPGSGQGE